MAMMAVMRAVRIHQQGGPDVLKYEDVPEAAIRATRYRYAAAHAHWTSSIC